MLEQTRNRVKCRHLSSHVVKDLHLTSLKIFHGNLAAAQRMANQEEAQTTVVEVKGDPMRKTTLSFRVVFAYGDVRWLPFTKDLDATVAIGTFFLAHPPLRHLSFQNAQAVEDFLRSKRREPITGVNTNVSEGLITLRMQHCGSCDEGGEKRPYRLLGRAYMVMYHMFASWVGLGSYTL